MSDAPSRGPDNRPDSVGDSGADSFPPGVQDWMPAVYEELRSLAVHYMSSERLSHTLQPTALVHEAYLRLQKSDVDGSSPLRFRGLAAKVMRNVLVDHARQYQYEKRKGALDKSPLSEETVPGTTRNVIDLLSLDAALDQLRSVDDRKARVVELRFFAGLTIPEIAEILGVSTRTVLYDCRAGCAWLRAELEKEA